MTQNDAIIADLVKGATREQQRVTISLGGQVRAHMRQRVLRKLEEEGLGLIAVCSGLVGFAPSLRFGGNCGWFSITSLE